VYSSTRHTMTVGEFFVIVRSLLEVILLQTSTVDPANHAFKLENIKAWVEATGAERLTIIFLTDWSKVTKRGIKVFRNDSDELGMSDDEVSEVLFDKPGCYTSFIMRCGIYNSEAVPRVIQESLLPSWSELSACFRRDGKVILFTQTALKVLYLFF